MLYVQYLLFQYLLYNQHFIVKYIPLNWQNSFPKVDIKVIYIKVRISDLVFIKKQINASLLFT